VFAACVIVTKNTVPAHLLWDHMVSQSSTSNVSRAEKRVAEQVSFNLAINTLKCRQSGVDALTASLKKVKLGCDVSPNVSEVTTCDDVKPLAAAKPFTSSKVPGNEIVPLSTDLPDVLRLHGEAPSEF